MKLEIDDKAIHDSRKSYDYFQEEAGELKALEFINLVNEALERISENPYLYQTIDESGYRRCSIYEFKQSIFYKVIEEVETVYVSAITGQRMKPDNWKDRK